MRWLAAWVVGAAVLRLAVVPAETCPEVSAAEVRGSIDEAVAWLVRGQRDDGRFLYGYDRDRDEVSTAYNSTRHAGVVDLLYRSGHVEAADAGLEHVLDNLVEHEGWTAFAPAGEHANVGANALVAAALVHRREVTGDPRHDGLIRRITRFLVAQQRPDGSILKYWSPITGRSVPDVFGKFSTGEAFWALALAGQEDAAHRTAVYLATRRDEAEGYALRQADHWAAYGLSALAGLTDVEAAYARRLAGYFGFLIRLESQQTGRPLNPLAESGARLGTMGEGAAALARLHPDLAGRVRCLAGILVERQAGPEERNPLARGAWFHDGYTQMDDQQHAVAALLGALEVLE